jgi:hypothetical protein
MAAAPTASVDDLFAEINQTDRHRDVHRRRR